MKKTMMFVAIAMVALAMTACGKKAENKCECCQQDTVAAVAEEIVVDSIPADSAIVVEEEAVVAE